MSRSEEKYLAGYPEADTVQAHGLRVPILERASIHYEEAPI